MERWKVYWLPALPLVWGLIGCSAPAPSSPAAGPRPVTRAPLAITAVTNDECKIFAEALAAAVNSDDPPAAVAFLDMDSLLQQVTKGVKTSEGFRRGYMSGFEQTEAELLTAIRKVVASGGSYDLLRVRDSHGEKRIIMRLLPPNSGFNYHEFVIKRINGRPKAVDLLPLTSGEWLSATLRRSFIEAAAVDNRSVLSQLTGEEAEYCAHQSRVADLGRAVRDGRSADALALYRGLPASVQTNRMVLILRLTAAFQDSEEEYLAAVNDMQKAFPDDDSLSLLYITAYVLNKQFDAAMASIDRLEKAVGGDPYLDVQRAQVLMEQGQYAAAKEAASKTMAAEPLLLQSYWTLVSISLREPNFDDALKWLTIIRGKFQLQFDDLTQLPEYVEFVKTPQYQEWLKLQQ